MPRPKRTAPAVVKPEEAKTSVAAEETSNVVTPNAEPAVENPIANVEEVAPEETGATPSVQSGSEDAPAENAEDATAEEGISGSPSAEEASEEAATGPVITITKPAVKQVEVSVTEQSEPLVLCVVLKDHECSISMQQYKVKKGIDVKLPVSVATILSQAGVVVKR